MTDNDDLFSATTISRKYHQDRSSANEQFLEETLTVEGEVQNIANVVSAVVMRVRGTGNPDDGTRLEVLLRNRGDAQKITRGETVRFRGICRGLKSNAHPTKNNLGWVKFEDATVLD